MSREKVKVELRQSDGKDLLVFDIKAEDDQNDYLLTLSDSKNSQNELKKIFTRLLEILLEKDIELDLIMDESFKGNLIEDVCKEYLKDLNTELKNVKAKIKDEVQ